MASAKEEAANSLVAETHQPSGSPLPAVMITIRPDVCLNEAAFRLVMDRARDHGVEMIREGGWPLAANGSPTKLGVIIYVPEEMGQGPSQEESQSWRDRPPQL